MLKIIIIGGRIAGNSTYKATFNYNNNIIIINIGEVNNKTNDLGLYKYIYSI